MTDTEPTITGYDPDQVMGWGEDQVAAGDADPIPNVLADVDYGQGLEADSLAEMDAVSAGFRARAHREADRMALALNTDYYLLLCFATGAQAAAFNEAVGWADLGVRYIDGREVAKRMGIELPPDPDWSSITPVTTWAENAITVQENRSMDGGEQR